MFIYFTNPIFKHCYLLAKALVSVYLEWNLFTTLTNWSTSLHAIFVFLLNLHLHKKSTDSTYTWFGIYYFTHLWYPSSNINNLSQFLTVKKQKKTKTQGLVKEQACFLQRRKLNRQEIPTISSILNLKDYWKQKKHQANILEL